MSIRIESLPAEFPIPPTTRLPTVDSFSPGFHERPWQTQTESPFEIAYLYGGASASVATVSQPIAPSERSSSSIPAQPPVTSFQAGNWSTSLQTVLDRPPAALPNHLVAGGVYFVQLLLLGRWWVKSMKWDEPKAA